MIDNDLLKLGFTHNESSVYLFLLKRGRVKAAEILKETNLQRSVVYGCLEELIRRDLVSKSLFRGIAFYAISDLEALVHEAEERKQLAKKISEQLKEQQVAKNRDITVYEGEDIIKRISDKNLTAPDGSTMYFLGPSKAGIQANLEKYWAFYHKKRVEKNISCKILYDKETDPKIVAARNSLPLCEAKYLPFETHMPMWFSICEDMVGMVVPSEDPPLSFLIKSKATADALKKYFDYLWQQK